MQCSALVYWEEAPAGEDDMNEMEGTPESKRKREVGIFLQLRLTAACLPTAAPATRPDSHGQPTHLHPHQAEGGRGAMWWPGRLPAAAPGQGRSGVAGSAEYVAIGVRVGMRDLENCRLFYLTALLVEPT
ncbi:hypothetical protein BC938DRAFT_483572 [Jimgerdemannia flammicorona]|uniref:Uncharacterized protein n=1 Tax=Jimgerdemannia flammicorona TaxID=994334 RepID=A0A433QVK6_9FUNG|nr:hypothetical protein BC938DRAFT_483572 [Jimgerdemannia flammicorona]